MSVLREEIDRLKQAVTLQPSPGGSSIVIPDYTLNSRTGSVGIFEHMFKEIKKLEPGGPLSGLNERQIRWMAENVSANLEQEASGELSNKLARIMGSTNTDSMENVFGSIPKGKVFTNSQFREITKLIGLGNAPKGSLFDIDRIISLAKTK